MGAPGFCMFLLFLTSETINQRIASVGYIIVPVLLNNTENCLEADLFFLNAFDSTLLNNLNITV